MINNAEFLQVLIVVLITIGYIIYSFYLEIKCKKYKETIKQLKEKLDNPDD